MMLLTSATCHLSDLFGRRWHDSVATATASILWNTYNFACSFHRPFWRSIISRCTFCILPTPATSHRQQRRSRSRHPQPSETICLFWAWNPFDKKVQFLFVYYSCVVDSTFMVFFYLNLLYCNNKYNTIACIFFITNFSNYLLLNKNKNEQTTLFIAYIIN